MKVENNKMK